MRNKHSNAQLKLVANSLPNEPQSQEWKEIRRDRLINSLNRINFHDGEIILNFKHHLYDSILSIPAIPQPCIDNHLVCNWLDPFEPQSKLI